MSTPMQDSTERRPSSRTRNSRPTTPLRPSSRSSFRDSARGAGDEGSFPLNTFEPAFAELSDAMADLEANMMHFQLMHESLARFSESFASFLYGLNMNAFCVDFPEAPVAESFRRDRSHPEESATATPSSKPETEIDATFMTTDTSFVENPQTATKTTQYSKAETRQSRLPARGGSSTRGRGSTRGGRARPSGLPAPRGRGLR
ncbi:hypothetical protein NLU13_8320 [Sarocladium strictum]|uniref:DASH complex subunit DAM1 n=1 Tax=Sarocladium strictum TaxID=5046 RepID=A0AA39GBG0_SARSR|nr:hypothetical protein NLU13_8320 [Sarocladium strictum]